MRALVTGGAGFLGYHLARELLSRGASIDLLDNFSRGVEDAALESLAQDDRIRLLEVDLRNEQEIRDLGGQYTHIFHLAAVIGVRHVLADPYRVLRDNVLMTLNVISLSKAQRSLESLVFSSTSEVYAGSIKYLETAIPTPETAFLLVPDLEHARTSYMLSKIYGEALLLQSGLKSLIVRLHNVYGPRMGLSHVIPELLQRAWNAQDGQLVAVPSADHSRTFCYVDDAIRMILALTERHTDNLSIFNVGNESPEITIGELAEVVFKAVGKELRISPAPPTPDSPRRRCPDVSRLRETTHLHSQVDLVEGVKKTFDWYRENIFTGSETTSI